MNSIEEYIRKLLGQQSPPAEIDAEGLWADIAAGLPPEGEQAPLTVPPKASRWTASLLISLALILFVGGGWWWLKGTTSEAQPLPQAIAAADTPSATTPKSSTSPAAFTDEIITAASQTAVPEVVSANRQTASATTLPARVSKLQRDNDFRGNANNPRASNPDVESATGTTAPPTEVNTPQETLTGPSAENKTTPNEEGTAVMRNTSTVTTLLPQTAVNNLVFTKKLPAVTLTVWEQKFKPVNQQRLSAGIHLGSNISLRRFASNGDDTGGRLNRATGQIVGQTAAVNLRYHFGNNLALNTGVEYNRTGNTFRYVSERDTLIPHPTPPNTGLLNAVVRRSVAHNNTETLIHVPLTIEYQHRFGDFSLGLGLGAGLNWQTAVSGKTIAADGRIVTYEAPLQRAFFISYQLQPRLTWQPNPERPWAFELRTDIRRFQLGVSPVTGTSQSGWLLGGGLGLRYSF